MKITILVKPNSRNESVVVLEDATYVIKVKAPPSEGKANERVIELLSTHFKKPKSSFEILHGHKGKKKIINVL